MYFPYLRARQFELITLRELINEGVTNDKIIPVLEPVKEDFNNLNLAHKTFLDKKFSSYLIVNPFQGKSKGDTQFFLDYLQQLDNSKFIPAFHYSENSDYIQTSISNYGLNNCLLICLDNLSDEEAFKNLCRNPSITHIMLLDPNKYRSLVRFIKTLGKFFIRLDDAFEKQPKNADYLDIAAHKFSEEHLYYAEEDFQGFSDFTVLSSEYIDGGSTPRAVVIHLTYIDPSEENQIWIRHFTSQTNDSISNVQGKFAEAANKVIDFCNKEGFTNTAIEELRNYVDNTRYPGLGTVKKISIKNHLLIVNNFLK